MAIETTEIDQNVSNNLKQIIWKQNIQLNK